MYQLKCFLAFQKEIWQSGNFTFLICIPFNFRNFIYVPKKSDVHQLGHNH